jgi:hypothetical protein
MANILPHITVTDPPRARNSYDGQETRSVTTGEGMSHVSAQPVGGTQPESTICLPWAHRSAGEQKTHSETPQSYVALLTVERHPDP